MNLKSTEFVAKKTDKYIFDGLEKNLLTNIFKIIIRDCLVSFKYKELIDLDIFEGLASADIDIIIKKFKLKSVDLGYKVKLTTFNDLDPYLVIKNCEEKKFLICIGISEIQPARYVAFLQGIALVE